MSQPDIVRLITLSALATLFVSCGGQNAAAPSAPPPPNVGVSPVTQQNVPVYGNWVASLDGYVNANIQPQVSGYLVRQNYREGSFVHKGEVLFQIDARPFQALLDQANGQLAQARGQLGQAQAQLGLAQINVRRDTPLAQAHAIAQSQLDNDVQAEKQAEALIKANQAAIASAEAAVEQAELNLGFTKVRSLLDGIAGIATTQIGNLVSQSTVLTTVSQVNPIKVYFNISEQEYLGLAEKIRGGQSQASANPGLLSGRNSVPLQLTLANDKIYESRGHILFADRSVNAQTGTIRIVGAFPNPHNVLRPGQFGRIRALTAMRENALLVPQSAVTELQGRYQVAVVGPDNKVKIHSVSVGEQQDKLWVITSGINPDDRVVSEGTSKVRDGQVVKPQQPQGPEPVSPYASRGAE